MIEIELDGQKVEVLEGSMVMHAAEAAGVYIPHFCYHKKLSIAANCRMCLVDVEKAPKPLPACATPVTQGMIVRTKSDRVIKAQQSVMEFLLINHPLDCPICDQGGECQLQDLAVGYGGSASRYSEEKRVVFHKQVGPLISMQEMSRCIHCTRCVRFGQELAGVMELGMIHRGEHSEITTVAGTTIDSELSGNMIDICPVGALTSKPFRYSARTWELSRRKSISPHDSTGSNLVVQVKANQVMRVVPLENEAVNECWIADRDRFSYEGLHADDRLTSPQIKQAGEWKVVDWGTALEFVANGLKQIKHQHGPQALGALAAPHSTVEELHLLAELMRGMGSDNIDYRLRHTDFGNVGDASTARWLGTSIASLSSLQRVFVIGSFLRKDHPLFAQRIRQAARKGAQVHRLQAVADDWLMPIAESLTATPSDWPRALAEVVSAIAQIKGLPSPSLVAPSAAAQAIAVSLLSGENKAVLLGNAAAHHPQAACLLRLAHWIGEHAQASVGYLTEAANAVGAQWVDALPRSGGLNVQQMLSGSLKAVMLLNIEPVLDFADGAAAIQALQAAEMVVALTPFKKGVVDHADVILPIAPFTETSGTYINAEGRVQSFQGVVKPLGETRPAWKVLRVLGSMLCTSDFAFDTSEQVCEAALGDRDSFSLRLSNRPSVGSQPVPAEAFAADRLERLSDVPIYATDSLVRRATALQLTADARSVVVSVSTAVWTSLGLTAGGMVRIRQNKSEVILPVQCDATLAPQAVRVPAAVPASCLLGPMFGPVSVEKA